jgi:hypothetical protein
MSEAVYAIVAAFLRERGWYQDGDDDGIWRRGDGIEPWAVAESGATIGAALDWQLVRDGIEQ